MIPNHNAAFIPPSHKSKKLRRRGNRIPAFTKIHEQPLLLPRYCGIGDVPSVVSADKTNDLLHTASVRSGTSAEKKLQGGNLTYCTYDIS